MSFPFIEKQYIILNIEIFTNFAFILISCETKSLYGICVEFVKNRFVTQPLQTQTGMGQQMSNRVMVTAVMGG
jgi:hypothetical protein